MTESVVLSRRTGFWGAAALVMLVGGCGASASAKPAPAAGSAPSAVSSAAPSAASSSSTAPIWKSVAGGCPTLPGVKRIVDGPFGQPNGADDATSYATTCSYGDPAALTPELFVTITIDRAHPVGTDWSVKQQTAESAVAYAKNLLVPLAGIGDGGFVVAEPAADAHPTVLAATWSGNAWVTANIRLAQPVQVAADVTAQSGRITEVLGGVLDDLRP